MTYKVIWNKTKNQYVVSELLHSSRKQRRIAKKFLSKQIAVLVVCGAVVASGVLPAQQVFANGAKTQNPCYGGGGAEESRSEIVINAYKGEEANAEV